MANRNIRPIWTEIGKIKPLGKTRRVKKAIPRPWRPFKIASYRLRERMKKPDELIIHRRISGRPDIAEDPRELMAVSKSRVRGTLPERIFYKKLLQRRMRDGGDFDFQSSLLGGRLQLGGIVADFMFHFWRLIVRVQGPTHKTLVQTFKDKQQTQLLVDMGYTVYDLDENIIYDPVRLEDWCRRYIDKMPSVGGRSAVTGIPTAGTIVQLATGEMNFAWTMFEHERVEQIEDDVINLQRDLERITAGRVITVNGLSDIDTNLGLVQAGEFRVGNARSPGFGFTGVRIGYPAFRYEANDWHIAGVNDDVLQFGLNAENGIAYAGGGAVWMSDTGYNSIVSESTAGYLALTALKWYQDGYSELDAVTRTPVIRISPYYLVPATPDYLALDIVIGRPVDTDNQFVYTTFHLDLHTRNTAGTGINTRSTRVYFYYDKTVYDQTTSWDEWSFPVFWVQDTRDGDFRMPFCFYEDPNTYDTWLTFDGYGDNPYSLGISPATNDFVITSHPFIDQSGNKVLQIDGRSSPLHITWNPENRDIDWKVHGDTKDDVLEVDAGLDLAFHRGAQVAAVFDWAYSTAYLSNSTAWHTDYTVVIPAGTLEAGDAVLVETWGIYKNNSGGNRTELRRYSVNATNYTFVADVQTSNAAYRPEHGTVIFFNKTTQSANERMGYWENHNECLFGSLTINTATTALTIKLERQWTTAHGEAQFYTRLNRTIILRS